MANVVTPSPSLDDVNKQAPINFDILNDKTRNACLKIIHQALEIDSDDVYNVFERARDVEAATFKLIGKGEVNGDYRSKMRSLSLNLKDKKNPSLRRGVVVGSIEADKLVTMSPEEMASDEKKAEREALQMQNLFKAKAAAAQGGCTHFHTRGRQSDCRFTLLQRPKPMPSSVGNAISANVPITRSRQEGAFSCVKIPNHSRAHCRSCL